MSLRVAVLSVHYRSGMKLQLISYANMYVTCIIVRGFPYLVDVICICFTHACICYQFS